MRTLKASQLQKGLVVTRIGEMRTDPLTIVDITLLTKGPGRGYVVVDFKDANGADEQYALTPGSDVVCDAPKYKAFHHAHYIQPVKMACSRAG